MRNQSPTFHFHTTFFTVLLAILAAPFQGNSQDTWSLERSIEYARTNSLSLRQTEYGIERARIIDKQNELSRLPNASASTNAGWQFGRTIDPTTNSFNNQNIAFNSMSLSVGATLFSGGRINNTIKQGKINIKAAEQDAATSFSTLALNIANAYLNILMAEEQLENTKKRLQLSQDQLNQTDKLISAGSIPANDRLDVLAQIANDEQAIIQSQNTIDINYLSLKEFMQLDPAIAIKVEKPSFEIPADANPASLNFLEVYSQALNSQPQILANELRVQSAEYDVNIARSGYYPTLSIFGGLDSRWSDASKLFTEVKFTNRVGQTFFINNPTLIQFLGQDNIDVEYDVPGADYIPRKYPYFDQIRDNFGQNVGLNLSIPIYSNGLNDMNVQLAKVDILSARLQSDLAKQQLKNDVQLAIANARSARLAYEASLKAVDAAKAAFENAEKRFNLGTINNLEFLTARNTYDIAQTNLTVSKYDYIFKLKILDFYLGRPIKLD